MYLLNHSRYEFLDFRYVFNSSSYLYLPNYSFGQKRSLTPSPLSSLLSLPWCCFSADPVIWLNSKLQLFHVTMSKGWMQCVHTPQCVSIKRPFACSVKFGCCSKWSVCHTACCTLILWLVIAKWSWGLCQCISLCFFSRRRWIMNTHRIHISS